MTQPHPSAGPYCDHGSCELPALVEITHVLGDGSQAAPETFCRSHAGDRYLAPDFVAGQTRRGAHLIVRGVR